MSDVERSRANVAPSLAGLPSDPAGRDVLAAEYVLGTLDSWAAQRIEAAMPAEDAWRQAVMHWERRLAPLALLARPETAPTNMWDRIEARISPPEPPKVRRARSIGWIWRSWALLATLAAAGLAAWILWPRPTPPRLLTVLANDRNLPGVLVERDPRGDLEIVAIPAATGRNLQAPSGRVLQLWAVAPGAQAPTNLGLLPHEPGRQLTVPARIFTPASGMLIEISVEPEGGSKTGRPTGPIIFVGRMLNIGAGAPAPGAGTPAGGSQPLPAAVGGAPATPGTPATPPPAAPPAAGGLSQGLPTMQAPPTNPLAPATRP